MVHKENCWTFDDKAHKQYMKDLRNIVVKVTSNKSCREIEVKTILDVLTGRVTCTEQVHGKLPNTDLFVYVFKQILKLHPKYVKYINSIDEVRHSLILCVQYCIYPTFEGNQNAHYKSSEAFLIEESRYSDFFRDGGSGWKLNDYYRSKFKLVLNDLIPYIDDALDYYDGITD